MFRECGKSPRTLCIELGSIELALSFSQMLQANTDDGVLVQGLKNGGEQ